MLRQFEVRFPHGDIKVAQLHHEWPVPGLSLHGWFKVTLVHHEWPVPGLSLHDAARPSA